MDSSKELKTITNEINRCKRILKQDEYSPECAMVVVLLCRLESSIISLNGYYANKKLYDQLVNKIGQIINNYLKELDFFSRLKVKSALFLELQKLKDKSALKFVFFRQTLLKCLAITDQIDKEDFVNNNFKYRKKLLGLEKEELNQFGIQKKGSIAPLTPEELCSFASHNYLYSQLLKK